MEYPSNLTWVIVPQCECVAPLNVCVRPSDYRHPIVCVPTFLVENFPTTISQCVANGTDPMLKVWVTLVFLLLLELSILVLVVLVTRRLHSVKNVHRSTPKKEYEMTEFHSPQSRNPNTNARHRRNFPPLAIPPFKHRTAPPEDFDENGDGFIEDSWIPDTRDRELDEAVTSDKNMQRLPPKKEYKMAEFPSTHRRNTNANARHRRNFPPLTIPPYKHRTAPPEDFDENGDGFIKDSWIPDSRDRELDEAVTSDKNVADGLPPKPKERKYKSHYVLAPIPEE
ncbi:hypothetical protein niasHS_005166 [Heterodera schachtii]|uniref:Uncharacterized protein n=1 Tax=Heterodera schachtii TaxID=97005 RepID=A0ABD2JRL8_HETSC